ncbi:RibD family protein [Pseudonocardia spinosispora]|uniref:RibD family protein n=1 Tax=Pseudonocardia spinosispora TaxID=103441 RepID=UPI000413ED96|nr:dihydrofolate reductase family protein [Pseudonocardia spinosispora]
MSEARPYVLLSVATSVDGYIDDASPDRLLLSTDADFDRVDQVRSESDAIMVGAGTIRADNPRLMIRSEARRSARVAAGRPEHPLKVTVSATGKLDPGLKFWHHGGEKVVYTVDAAASELRRTLAGLADVVSLGPTVDFAALLDDLGGRGVRSLMVEGGSSLHTAFLAADLADEVQLAIAPLLVGEATAPRFLNPADYPGAPHRRMRLIDLRQLDDIALLRYAPRG